MKNAIQFGAGNIGRGFIGALLAKAGYNVLFVDINEEILDAINNQKSYKVFIKDAICAEDTIQNISAMHSLDEDLIKEIAKADIITTAIGASVLTKIASTIAKGIAFRMQNGINIPLNIIACENMVYATDFLKNVIIKNFSEEELDYIEKYVGFVNCSVDRIIPPVKNDNIIDVTVERFFEWNVEEPAFKGEIPKVDGMHLTQNLKAYIERKLFTLNTGHAITAYLGYIKGYKTINEAIEDKNIQNIVRNAMQESGKAICQKHNLNQEEHFAYIEKIIDRFKNKYLKDDIIRVGREPLRKLSKDDRLIKPLNTAIQFDIEHTNLIYGIASALKYYNKDDNQSIQMQDYIKDLGLNNAIKKITNIQDENLIQQISNAYENIEDILK